MIIVATGVYALLLKFLQKNSPYNVQMFRDLVPFSEIQSTIPEELRNSNLDIEIIN